jgi:uncharacterized cupredoxin-like copper-binding protein
MKHRIHSFVLGVALAACTSAAWAHGNAHDSRSPAPKPSSAAPAEQKDWGIAGEAKAVKRIIHIRMTDNMRFTPAHITVQQGETIRFVVHNQGKLLHEMVIGTQSELDAHAEMMKKHPGMEHDEPYMAHVDPAQTSQIVWHFNRAGDLRFACLLPGHYQAGMVGTITVKPRSTR